jgi:hypothetical protein
MLQVVALRTTYGQLREGKQRFWSRKRRQIKRLWDFRYLVRDQEVEGSNPFAPTTPSGSNPDTVATEHTGHIGNNFGPKWVF